MQPYFMPYLGYFQLIESVDQFVIYDDVEYTKRGWINRNRILSSNGWDYFTIPLVKDSDYEKIGSRTISSDFVLNGRRSILRKIEGVYRKAPYYGSVISVIESIIMYDEISLFRYVMHSILEISNWLELNCQFVVSSSLDLDSSCKGSDRVLEICSRTGASHYHNPIGGVSLYERDRFLDNAINLRFLKPEGIVYPQFQNEFEPSLSILDVMMFNSKDEIQNGLIKRYTLI